MRKSGIVFFLLFFPMIIPALANNPAIQNVATNAESVAVQGLEVPPLRDRVMDLANILKANETANLKSKLQRFEADTTAQVGILIIPDLQGEELEEYSLRVANTWKLGRKDRNNGVLILVAMNDRRIRIEVGLGLESVLSNQVCTRILQENMIPRFRAGDYYGGLDSGVSAIIEILSSSQM